IAASLGFSDPFYFSRLFKKYKGLPPSRFRK
ncbi:MAG: AraC family transcriptional regulator, partial [Phycisphaerae bacterium]|nr:AraC family transcriptional regulator [Phycisphaerae bacterium]